MSFRKLPWFFLWLSSVPLMVMAAIAPILSRTPEDAVLDIRFMLTYLSVAVCATGLTVGMKLDQIYQAIKSKKEDLDT